MPKFKVGDKVRIVTNDNDKNPYNGLECIIRDINPNGTYLDKIHYGLVESPGCFVYNEDELELVKPKFDIKDYSSKHVIHIKSEEEAKIFTNYLTSLGIERDYRNCSGFGFIDDDTCLNLYNDWHSDKKYYKVHGYTILEFEDFDWSDFTMKKEFTKKDLKNGDVVKRRNGDIGIIITETNSIVFTHTTISLSSYNNDLYSVHATYADIMAVRRPIKSDTCCFEAFRFGWGDLVYERKEVEEMTLAEVCKALGKEIKIVKE